MSVFKQARAKVSLSEFLAKELNAKQVVTGSNVRQNACPNPKCSPKETDLPVSITGDFFRCWACGSRGDVSAAATLLWGASPQEAARRLISMEGYAVPAQTGAANSKEKEDAILKILAPLKARPIDPIGADWLMSRGISESMIQQAVSRGLLAFLPGSPDRAMEWLEAEIEQEAIRMAGMWREGSRAPAIIFRPVVFTGNASAEFRLAREPNEREPKALRFGRSEMWSWQGDTPGYAIVSGMMDLLSLAQLGYRGTIYGLAGITAWNSENFPDPGQGRAQIVFESGPRGASSAESLRDSLKARGIEAIIKPAHEKTGINGVLMQSAAK